MTKLGSRYCLALGLNTRKAMKCIFATGNYKDCEIKYLSAKNDAIVFVVTKAEALKHNLIQEVEYE